MLDRELADRAVRLDDVDRAPVCDSRHGEARDGGERLAVVERARELGTGVEEELLSLLGALAVVDVRCGADPDLDLTALADDRDRAPEMPAIAAVGGAEAVLDLEDLAGRQRLRTALLRGRQVVGMADPRPRFRVGLLARHAGVLEPALVEVRRVAVRVRRPNDLRHRVGETPVALLALAANGPDRLLA